MDEHPALVDASTIRRAALRGLLLGGGLAAAAFALVNREWGFDPSRLGVTESAEIFW